MITRAGASSVLRADPALVDLARTVFDASDDRGQSAELDVELWSDLEKTGLARLTLPSSMGGSDAGLAELAVVLAEAGAAGARVPLMETCLLAGWLAQTAGTVLPAGPVTAVRGRLTATPGRETGTWSVSGATSRVLWPRACTALVVLTDTHVIVLDPRELRAESDGVNLAEEPWAVLVADGVVVPASAVAPAPDGAVAEYRLRAALGRALLLAGAVGGALAATVRYANEREQFGRPISRFQAVQQHIALAAAEVAAASAAAVAATHIAAAGGFADESTSFAIAAAKARTGEAAGVVARIAHQVHGAMGFTREHRLRLLTTRLWTWRDEDGSDGEWNAELGARVLAAGSAGLWPLLLGGADAPES